MNTRELKVAERVQIRRFHDQSTKWKFGAVTNKYDRKQDFETGQWVIMEVHIAI